MSSSSSLGPVLALLAVPPLGYFAWRAYKQHEERKSDDAARRFVETTNQLADDLAAIAERAYGGGYGAPPAHGAPAAPAPAPKPPAAPPVTPKAPAAPPATSSPSAPPTTILPTKTAPAPTAPAAPVKHTTAPAVDPSVRPPLGRLMSTSKPTAKGGVVPTDLELLAQARALDPTITLDEYAGARLIASERGEEGTFVEWLCIVDTELNRAARSHQTLYESLTRGGGFGAQGRARPASTRRDPHEAHVTAARGVLHGYARGIARDAIQFFDPLEEDATARAGVGRCDALAILERWSYDYPTASSGGCALDYAHPGHDTQAWVGPIPGVDASRLMLFEPMPISDPRHFARYTQALAVITRARAGKAVS